MMVSVGCAPSLRMVHQSNAYFERCHAADFDPTVRPGLRRECWGRWLRYYTEGQPPDRVEYARNRAASLDDGEAIVPLPGMRPTAMGSSHTASFLPTSSEQPDGTSTTVQLPDATRQALEAPAVDLPPPPDTIGACASVCGPRWDACMTPCEGRAAGCREACEHEHRTCMRGCY